MKAILRSINNFSCKLKQSNNQKYNIVPRISNNKLKSISGNGNITIEDAIKKDLKDYRVYGKTYQNSTNGINEWNSFNKTETNSYKVLEDGTIQLINSASTANGYTSIGKSLKEMCPNLNVGDTVYLYIVSTWYRKEIYSSSIGSWTNGNSKTLTQQMLDSNIILYGGYQTTSTIKIMITKNQYYDTYEPYTNGVSPNPDYPQEMVNCGDRTKNLFDKTSEIVENKYYTDTGSIANSTGDFISETYIPVQTGNYTLSTSGSTTLRICTYDSSKTFIRREIATSSTLLNIAINSNEKYVRITGKLAEINSMQLEKGTTATSYEPYGYKIPVNVRSENLFDKDNANVLNAYFGISDNKDVITSASTNRMIYIPCKPNTTYTILKSLSTQFSIGYTYVQPEAGVSVYGMLEGTKCSVRNDDINTIVHLSITTNENAKYLVLRYTNTNNDTNSTWQEKLNVIQILEGTTTPTKYQPYYNETTNIYLDEPLRGIGEYSDYIDFINGKVVRQLGEVILDGSETWNKNQTWSDYGPNTNAYTSYKSTMPNAVSNAEAISSHFIRDLKAYSKDENGLFEFSTYPIFRISKDIAPTVTDFKTWLSENNVTVDYVLDTPTEESITLPNIKLIEGKNIITIGTEVQGVFEAEYYSKEIIDISDYKYNLRKVED